MQSCSAHHSLRQGNTLMNFLLTAMAISEGKAKHSKHRAAGAVEPASHAPGDLAQALDLALQLSNALQVGYYLVAARPPGRPRQRGEAGAQLLRRGGVHLWRATHAEQFLKIPALT